MPNFCPMTPAVLVVEPESSLRGRIAWCLLARGYRVLAAETVLEATHSLLAGGVDLMILDMDLPPAGARALLRYMSEDAELAQTRVVVMGKTPPPDLNASFLQKPFCDEDLVDSVYRMLGPPRRQSQSGNSPRLPEPSGV
jgi:DNA-binding NtrC family response regulator